MTSIVSVSPGIPLEALVGEVRVPVPMGRVLLGGSLALPAATLLSGVLAASGGRVLFVDGANAFDPYVVASYARRIGLHPKEILDRENFLLSRAFTCHQLTVLLEERVQEHLERNPALLVVSGPLTTFMDEGVPWREVKALFKRLQRTLLGVGRTPLLIAQPSVPGAKERQALFRELPSLVETVALAERDEWGPRVRILKPLTRTLRPGEGGALLLLAHWEESRDGTDGRSL